MKLNVVSINNYDQMEFDQAFKTARLDNGNAGDGVFFWQGKPYTTLTAEEETELKDLGLFEEYQESIVLTLKDIDWGMDSGGLTTTVGTALPDPPQINIDPQGIAVPYMPNSIQSNPIGEDEPESIWVLLK